MFLETFIKRPILSSVCSIIILFCGLICIPLLPVEQYPQLAPPQILISANYIGANAQTVESTVTTPLEQAINGVEGMKYITSSSSNDGSCTITVTFNSNRSLDDALLDVQSRVKEVEPRLPQEVKMTGVNVTKSSSAIVILYALSSKNNIYSTEFISNYIDRYIKDYLQRVDGVARLNITGERKYAMRIWLDPYKLAGLGMNASDVSKVLTEQNMMVAAGQIGAAPISNSQEVQLSILTQGRLQTVKEFEEIVLKSDKNNVVRLKDVARVELGAENYNLITKLNGDDAIGIEIYQLPTANAMNVAKNIKAEMAKLEKKFPAGLEVKTIIDTSNIVEESINEVLLTLIGSIILVILVIYVFLQKLNTTIIPAVTIPVSLVGTFVMMKLLGFSINSLTLFGIVLATGLVVDDAIIVVENIERFMREHKMPPLEAAINGMKEIFGAVIATSLVLITVFLPISFFPGTTGILYRQFALTIACSIAISAFVSLTLTPAMTAIILKNEAKEVKFFKKFNDIFDKIKNKYNVLLRFVIRNSNKAIAVFIILLGITCLLFKVVPQSFIPIEDQEYFMVMIQSPPGIALQKTSEIADKVYRICKQNEDIIQVYEFTGFNFTGQTPTASLMFVALKPNHERKGVKHSAKYIVNKLNVEFSKIPDAIIVASEPPAVQGLGSIGGFQFELQDNGDNFLTTLSDTTQKLIIEASKTGKLTGLFTSFNAETPQINLVVDKLKVKQLNIPLNYIYDALQVYIGSYYVNDFTFMNKIYRVYLQADKDFRANTADIGRLYIRTPGGDMVSLANLTSYSTIFTADSIQHYNLRRSTEITGSAANGVSMGQAVKAMENIAKEVLPRDFSFEWSGLVFEQQESGNKTLLIFALSFIFVFLILAAQYESLYSPVVIMFAVPLALFGAMLFQYLRGLENNVFCQIGLVMLIGLAGKNAILIVEFANQLREQGLTIEKAAIESCLIRFRPIIMTSFACILGILPLVLATGTGSLSRISMGTAVFGGMIVSTVLNLFITPVIYIAVMRLQEQLTMFKNPNIKKKIFNWIMRFKNEK